MDKHKRIFVASSTQNRCLYIDKYICQRIHIELALVLQSDKTLTTQKSPISDGPIHRSSSVLNPFSPVPTNAITNPKATVPSPTYKNALANELGPRSTPKMSSSSDEPNDESWICLQTHRHKQ